MSGKLGTARNDSEAPQAGTEKLLLPARWVVLVVISVGLGFSAVEEDGVWPLPAGLVLLVVMYNLGVSILVRRGATLARIRLISPLVHGSLAVVGLLATGGLHSPFHPLLAVVLAAVAMRLPPRLAIILGTALIAAFSAGVLVISGTANIGRLAIFACFNFLALWMVAALARESAKNRAGFLQIVAHELRNPMAAVKGICSLLRLNAGSPGVGPSRDTARMAEIMEREVDRLSDLLNEVLEAFLVQEGRLSLKRERVNLMDVVTSALRPFQAMSGTSGRFGKHCFVLEGAGWSKEDGTWILLGDSNRLELMVSNLLSNAVKYSPDGGEVRLSLTVEPQRGRAVFAVKDEGIGIPKDQLANVFERFYRANNLTGRDPGGIGLGLYICRDIVERHGGRIWAESDAGLGTTFRVELPVHTR